MIFKDIRLIIRDRSFSVLLVFLAAAAVVAILFGRSGLSTPRINMGIVDNDKTEYSKLLITYLEENTVFNSYINVVEGTEQEMKASFYEGGLDLYFVIPEEFSKNLMVINNIPMKVVINSSDTTKAVLYNNLLKSYSRYISAVELNCQSLYEIMLLEGYPESLCDKENVAISYDLLFTALGKDAFFNFDYEERFTGVSLVNYYVYSAIVLAVMYIGMLAGLSSLRERLSNVSIRLKAAGIPFAKQAVSKTMAYTIVYGGLVLLVMLTVNIFAEFSFPARSIVLSIVAIFAAAVVFSVIGRMCKSTSSYIIAANMIILLLTIVGGGIIPVMYLPEAIAKLARFTPNYWFIRVLL